MSNLNTALVVPVDMAALCVGDTDVNGSATNPYGTKDFSRLAPDFSLLPYAENGTAHNRGPYISYQVLADSFQQASNPLDVGIHLHWALPDAVAHGHQPDGQSSIEFPAAPNRWLVTRIVTNTHTNVTTADSKSPTTDIKAWVIESDRLWDRQQPATNALIQNTRSLDTPLQPNPTAADNQSTKAIGQSFDFDQWAEDNNADRMLLTALGYGEPTYAAAYEFCPNVFGFWDTLEDLDPKQFPADTTRVSYMLAGWYADSSDDPLTTIQYPADADYQQKLALIKSTYHWVFQGDTEQTIPSHTLFNALITDIPWDRKTHFLNPKTPAEDLEIAVGNTTAEALSALIAAQPEFEALKNIEVILNALQIGLLNRMSLPSGLAEIDEALHQKDFSSASHGTLWEIKPKTDPSDGNPLTIDGQLKSTLHDLANLPEEVATKLNTLNADQQALDQAQLSVTSLRQRIFYDWIRTMRLEYSSLPPGSVAISANDARAFIEKEIDSLKTQLDQCNNLNQSIAQQKQALVALLTDDFELATSNSARFWNPGDPVTLLSGTDVEPPFRYKPTEGIDDDGNLICRLAGNCIAAMSVNDGAFTIHADNLPTLTFSNQFIYAAELQALLGEAFFVDPKQAAVLASAVAKLGGNNNPAIVDLSGFIKTIIAAQQALFTEQQQESTSIEFVGTPPTLVSVKQWVRPWIPIIMEWEVTHYPNALAPYDANFVTNNYEMSPDDIDLVFKGSIPVDTANARTYQGTIVLTHNTEINIKDQIARYLKNFPDDDHDGELQKIYDQLNLPMQAQAMSGFNEALLMLNHVLQMEVSDPLGILQGMYFSNFTNVLVKGAVNNENKNSPLANNTFGPIRSGGLKINRLRVVDTFGQAMDIENPAVIRAESFISPRDKAELISLPVRYTQPARLLFRWLSAQDDQVEVNSHPASSPVCGWVLFNHLDDSLVIYDEAGAALGSFNVLGPFWSGAPGNQATFNKPIEDVFANANPHLKNFALGINGAPNPKEYLKDMLKTIDDSMTFISPKNYKQQKGLSVLIGRPLALVRASLNMDLLGMPAINQSKQAFADAINNKTPIKRENGGAPGVDIPVRLGELSDIDDGLVGYFIDDGTSKAYQHFYAPAAPKNSNNGVAYPKFDQIVVNSDQQTPPVLVSMLMDPHASIHATTGLLPMKELMIPPSIIANNLSAMAVTFLTTPVIIGDVPNLPVPDESGYSWSWVTLENDASDWTVTDLNASGADDPLTMVQQHADEGWLKLVDDDSSAEQEK